MRGGTAAGEASVGVVIKPYAASKYNKPDIKPDGQTPVATIRLNKATSHDVGFLPADELSTFSEVVDRLADETSSTTESWSFFRPTFCLISGCLIVENFYSGASILGVHVFTKKSRKQYVLRSHNASVTSFR